MDAISHPILKNIKNNFRKPDSSNLDIMQRCSLPSNVDFKEFRGNIAWELVENRKSMNWGTLYSSEIISRLEKSALEEYDTVYLQIGYEEPVFKLDTSVFINYWEAILHVSAQGFPLMTPDKKLYLEFLYTPKIIYSNFLI
jgi:hypothetical protein